MRIGLADLPLHSGSCPKWLFEKMKKLGKIISEIIIHEYGRNEFLKRISDPFFFQALACALGYDWHSSGTTTVTLAALKEANLEEFGIAILGGKGRTSRKTPEEIEKLAETFSFSTQKIERLKYASRMSAKIDNYVVQDNFQLYHHSFIITENGNWATIQQGMNPEIQYARRYHWLSKKVKSFVTEPHIAICCDIKVSTLNMTAKENEEVRKCSVDLIKDNPKNLLKYVTLKNSLFSYLRMQKSHLIDLKTYGKLMDLHEFQPKNYEELVSIQGIGAKTIRSLALISNLIFGAKICWRDPTKFSFTHGGKDATPYPVDRKNYDKTIQILKDAIENAKIGNKEKLNVLQRMQNFLPEEFK